MAQALVQGKTETSVTEREILDVVAAEVAQPPEAGWKQFAQEKSINELNPKAVPMYRRL
jgi:hypothetical protein